MLREHFYCREQHIMHRLHRIQSAYHSDQRSARRQAQFLTKARLTELSRLSDRNDAVSNDPDLIRAITAGNQPVANRLGVRKNAVGEPADSTLYLELSCCLMSTCIANRRDRHRHARELCR